MTNTEKLAALKAAMQGLKKSYGEGAIMRLGEQKISPIETVSTGSLSIDLALGGGYPKGRIIEVYGPESSGTTTLCLHAAAEFQKKGGIVAFIDAEHALDPLYAKAVGVDIDNLLLSQPDSGEQALEIVEALVRSGAVDLIIVDSVAALTPKAEIDGDMGEAQMGLQARLMSQALRKLTAVSSKMQTTIIFINQLRMKIGVMFGNPETTTGGNALKFYASVRIEVRKGEKIGGEKNTDQTGHSMKVKVVKNKVAPPFRGAVVDVLFGQGIDKLADIVDTATKADIITKSGAFYSYKGTKLGQGRLAAMDTIRNNTAMLDEIYKETIAKNPLYTLDNNDDKENIKSFEE